MGVQIISGGNTYNAALVFVSAVQINGLIPSNVPVGNAQVAVTYTTPSLIPIPGLLAKQFTITRVVTMKL